MIMNKSIPKSDIKKIKIIALPRLKDALKRQLKYLVPKAELTDQEEFADGIILDLSCYDSYKSAKYFLHLGLQHLYRFVAIKDKEKPVFLVAGLKTELSDKATGHPKLETELNKIATVCIVQSNFSEKLKSWVENLTAEIPRESFKKLSNFLRQISEEQYHNNRFESRAANLLKEEKWNVLVIDNDLTEGEDSLIALYRVLGFPDNEFNQKINAFSFCPSDLTRENGDLHAFLINLRYSIYKNDIDLILLDLSLGYGKTSNKNNLRTKRFGFNFLDLIQQQCAHLGWRPLPIITFTSFDNDTSLTVESIGRGSKWFATKHIGREYIAKNKSWIGKLPDILEEIYSSQWSKYEYLQKYLPSCHGRITKDLYDLLHSQLDKNYIPDTEVQILVSKGAFDLADPFFVGNSISILIETCLEKNGVKVDLNKFWEYHFLLCQLFTGYDSIKITGKSKFGFSPTTVFFVTPFHEGVEHSNHIVKIGARETIELEFTAFEEWIDGLLDTFIGRIKGKPVQADIYSGLLYVSVGIKNDYSEGEPAPQTLLSILERMLEDKTFRDIRVEPEEIKEFISFLFTNVLSCFYDQRNSKHHNVYSNLISAYLEDMPSFVSGTFGEFLSPKDLIEGTEKQLKTLDELIKEPVLDSLTKADKIYLKNFKIYEVDRIGKKLKLTNRYRFLPGEDVYYPLKVKGKEYRLHQLSHRTDLRVDVELAGTDGEKILQDPRFVRGKRVSLSIINTKIGWEDARIRFLDGSKPKQKLFHACREFLSKYNTDRFGGKKEITLFQEKDGKTNYWLFDQMKKIVGDGILTTPRELTFSHIHGDLNLENILLTRSDKKLLGWFIDFARSREGHAVFDFVKLETEIKTQLVAPYLYQLTNQLTLAGVGEEKALACSLELFIHFEQTSEIIANLNNFLGKPSANFIEYDVYADTLRKIKILLELILLIRKLASHYNFGTEYNWGILLYSMSALKFGNLEKLDGKPVEFAPLPKMLAYLSACCALQKLYVSDPYLLKQKPFQKIYKKGLKEKKEGRFLSKHRINKMFEAFYQDPHNNKALLVAFLETVRDSKLPKPNNDK
jgi:hypothetical protein